MLQSGNVVPGSLCMIELRCTVVHALHLCSSAIGRGTATGVDNTGRRLCERR